jgi:uncharacterized repeat protein (TIGR03803 family)
MWFSRINPFGKKRPGRARRSASARRSGSSGRSLRFGWKNRVRTIFRRMKLGYEQMYVQTNRSDLFSVASAESLRNLLARWRALCLFATFLPLAGPSVADGQEFRILHSFDYYTEGLFPRGTLAFGDSTLYGSTGDNGAVFKMSADGTGFSSLPLADVLGNGSNGNLTLGASVLYGMTSAGGAGAYGTIFKIDTRLAGVVALHSFAARDGAYPYGGLTLSGTTLYGMASQTPNGPADDRHGGTVFRLNTDGTGFTVLHSFGMSGGDGGAPLGDLTVSGSTLYGMTAFGGANDRGTIFRVSADGTDYAVLHSFVGGAADGANPYGSLTLHGSTLFGMTSAGGASDAGAMFRMETDGGDFSLLHSFSYAGTDGRLPYGSLTMSGSTLFGMTSAGGAHDAGTVFSMDSAPLGDFRLLHSFGYGTDNGLWPYGSLTLGGSTLYGMTSEGGASAGGWGTVFALSVPEPSPALMLTVAAIALAARACRAKLAHLPQADHAAEEAVTSHQDDLRGRFHPVSGAVVFPFRRFANHSNPRKGRDHEEGR